MEAKNKMSQKIKKNNGTISAELSAVKVQQFNRQPVVESSLT